MKRFTIAALVLIALIVLFWSLTPAPGKASPPLDKTVPPLPTPTFTVTPSRTPPGLPPLVTLTPQSWLPMVDK